MMKKVENGPRYGLELIKYTTIRYADKDKKRALPIKESAPPSNDQALPDLTHTCDELFCVELEV